MGSMAMWVGGYQPFAGSSGTQNLLLACCSAKYRKVASLQAIKLLPILIGIRRKGCERTGALSRPKPNRMPRKKDLRLGKLSEPIPGVSVCQRSRMSFMGNPYLGLVHSDIPLRRTMGHSAVRQAGIPTWASQDPYATFFGESKNFHGLSRLF